MYLRDLDGCEGRGDAVRRRRGREGCLGIFRGEGQQRAEDRVGVCRRVGGDDVSHDHAVREAAPRSGSDDYAHARRVFDSGAGGDRIDEHGLVSLRNREAQTGERHVSRHRSDRRRDRRPRRRVGRQGSYRRRRHRLRRGPRRRLGRQGRRDRRRPGRERREAEARVAVVERHVRRREEDVAQDPRADAVVRGDREEARVVGRVLDTVVLGAPIAVEARAVQEDARGPVVAVDVVDPAQVLVRPADAAAVAELEGLVAVLAVEVLVARHAGLDGAEAKDQIVAGAARRHDEVRERSRRVGLGAAPHIVGARRVHPGVAPRVERPREGPGVRLRRHEERRARVEDRGGAGERLRADRRGRQRGLPVLVRRGNVDPLQVADEAALVDAAQHELARQRIRRDGERKHLFVEVGREHLEGRGRVEPRDGPEREAEHAVLGAADVEVAHRLGFAEGHARSCDASRASRREGVEGPEPAHLCINQNFTAPTSTASTNPTHWLICAQPLTPSPSE